MQDLKIAILQAKPDSLHDFVLAYVNSLETKGEKPTTIDLEEYDFNEKREKKRQKELKEALVKETKWLRTIPLAAE